MPLKTIAFMKVTSLRFLFLSFFCAFVACQDSPPPAPVEIVREPELLNPRTGEVIAEAIAYALENSGRVDDSIVLAEPDLVAAIHTSSPAKRVWSDERRWLAISDTLVGFVRQSERQGLFPKDYHLRHIESLRLRLLDSAAMSDAALWARGELMMSDAFALLCRHLKLGRLKRDSVSLRQDSVLKSSEVTEWLGRIQQGESMTVILASLEPRHPAYLALKEALPAFLDSMDRTPYTYIQWPKKDSISFVRQLQSRLFEDAYISFNTREADSTALSEAIRKAQEDRGLKVDGKAGPQLVGSLNNTGLENFIRIAINMDRYKLLPDSMPPRYVWVNLPAYRMSLVDSGNVLMESKVIVGQPKTRTPVLNSRIYNLITMPQWTVPYSIIFNEMLPKIQKSTDYLRKENLMVVDRYDSIIPPDSIDWSKLNKKNFPYLLKQRQGDDNSLGVIKFNFYNKYDVYLHDTNARGLFNRQNRAMSHGCVRIQKWDSLARVLASVDTLRHHPDSIAQWIKRGEKRSVALRDKVPIYIRYFTTEAQDGQIRFFDDIYAEDKLLRDRHFSSKF
jgi:murein L,D-transpeptidase YcbB/YkuD